MLRILILIILLSPSSYIYASERSEICKILNSVSKYVKVEKKIESPHVLEIKSRKFNIVVTRNSEKNLNATLRKAKNVFDSGKREEAILLLNMIIAKFPYNKNTLILLGNIYYVNQEYKKAKDIYVKLLQENPSDLFVFKNFLIVLSKYDTDLALDLMLELYSKYRDYPPLLASLSLIFVEKQDLVRARQYMLSALSLDQNNIFYAYNLAVILDRLSDLENAEVLYARLLNQTTTHHIPTQQIEARLHYIRALPR